ncbi:MAG: hypothetical protein K8S97_12445 [Anaerolineae bacterium]|nr:hypothetical protein [Anaerolineae bacterium]
MRVVINEAQVKRNRQISHILFLVSLAGMGISFFYTWTSSSNSSANNIGCMVLPILMLLTLTSVRMANTWIREPRPSDVLGDALKGLGQKHTIFHYLLPAPHVLVGPEGVFAITIVWQEGEYRVKEKKWFGDDGLSRKLLGYMRQDLIGNPFNDALFSTQQVQRFVDKIAPDKGIEVQPVIVLIHPNIDVEIEDPLFPVLYAEKKKSPSLPNFLKQQNNNAPTLTEEDLDKLDHMYGLVTRQEVAEMLGETWDNGSNGEDVAADDSAAETTALDAPRADPTGVVFVAQASQLFYIGATDGMPEDTIAELGLQDEVNEDIELVRTFESANPAKAARRLTQKFDRKRQKVHWYGLSKKDIAWLMEQDDQS